MPLTRLWPFKPHRQDRRKSSPREREEWEMNARYERDREELDELDRRLRLLAAEAAVFARKELP